MAILIIVIFNITLILFYFFQNIKNLKTSITDKAIFLGKENNSLTSGNIKYKTEVVADEKKNLELNFKGKFNIIPMQK